MKKLFFCDIDGTIMDGSRNMPQVSDYTKYAISQLVKDNYVFIASGRCKGLLEKQIFDLNTNGLMLCNGAYAECEGNKIVSERFDSKTINKIRQVVFDNNGFYVLEALDKVFTNDIQAEDYIRFMKSWYPTYTDLANYEQNNIDIHIAMAGFKTEQDCLNSEKQLQGYVDILRHNTYKSYDYNILGVNKGTAAKKIMEYLGIDINDTYAFGDGINDLEMLQAVRHGVIMENHDKKLDAYDFEKTDDVLNDGFYNYLVRNNLIKEK